nr:hypothetical protein [Tanacetum cinerariifolium]
MISEHESSLSINNQRPYKCVIYKIGYIYKLYWSNLGRNINTTQAQQKARDDALVAHADRLEFGKCNMRLDTNIEPKEATYQVVLDAFALTSFYQAFLITTKVPAIYMQDFWATVSVQRSSIRFMINKKKVSLNVEIFREILQFCPKIPRHEFEDLLMEHDILSFIRDLGHYGDIIYLTDVSVDYLHQPWRAFATVINKCLSGKETGKDKIRLSPYKTYYAFASGEKTPKPKYIRKKADSDTSPKQKPVQASKGVPDEQHLKTTGADEEIGTILGVLDVPIYESESKKESWGDSGEEDKDDENDFVDKNDGNYDDGGSDDLDDDSDEERTKSDRDEIPDPNLTNIHDEENIDDEERMDEEEEDENPSRADNEIASLMETLARHATTVPEITSYFTTTIPSPPLLFNPLLQQATPTPTPTTSKATTSFSSLPDFSFVFRFNDRVTNLEKDLLEIKQVDQEEVKTQLLKILLKAVLAFATPVIERNVTESLETAILARSSSQPKSTYEATASLFEFELTKILLDKIEEDNLHLRADYKKKLYDALVESHNTHKDLFNTYDRGTKRRKSSKEAELSRDSRPKEKKSSSTLKDASQSQHKHSGKSAYAEEPSHIVDDSIVQQDQEFNKGNNDEQPVDKEGPKCQHFYAFAANTSSSKDVYSSKRIIAVTRLSIMKKYDYGHLEEIEVRREDKKLYKFRECDFLRLRLQDIEDMLLLFVQQKLTNLTIDKRYALNVALRMFTRWIVIQRRVEDLQLGVKSYQKKLNLTNPDTFRSNLRNKTTYTAYSDPKGVIYKDQMNKNILLRANELHKFSDGTLNDVWSTLHDIAKGIRMEYLPKRKWSGLDKRRAQ